jgi:5'-AMP-activated protein kinase regulatory gamma subunit
VSAVPILDAEGHLVGNVSARDARALINRPTALHMIDHPLGESKDLHFQPFSVELISCVEDDTLESVINKLAESRVHRVYLCDADFKAIGVISLRDIIALFVREPSADYMADYFVEKVGMF